MGHSNTANAHHPHVTPLKVYLGVGGALLFLTIITVAAAAIDFGHLTGIPWLNLFVAMVIATIKGTLVVMFFMHLYYDHKIYTMVFLTGLICLGIMLVLTLFDTQRRADLFEQEAKPIKPATIYEGRPPVDPAAGEHH